TEYAFPRSILAQWQRWLMIFTLGVSPIDYHWLRFERRRMKKQDTDKYWQFIGNDNPYWGVITHDEFDKTRLTREAIEDFYESGETHADLLFRTIHRYIDERFVAESALDFGCGVGRIVVPLASRCRRVTGVDVSDGMLRRAQERCDVLRLSNIRLIKGDDQLSLIAERIALLCDI